MIRSLCFTSASGASAFCISAITISSFSQSGVGFACLLVVWRFVAVFLAKGHLLAVYTITKDRHAKGARSNVLSELLAKHLEYLPAGFVAVLLVTVRWNVRKTRGQVTASSHRSVEAAPFNTMKPHQE